MDSGSAFHNVMAWMETICCDYLFCCFHQYSKIEQQPVSEVEAPWQLEYEKVEQRCRYLLTSGLWSDCIFMVGSETNQEMIQAHKLVLAMASPVFERMFYGGLSKHNPTDLIPDFQPDAFRALLQYIYTGSINIGSLDLALNLLYGAKKYMLPHLEKECFSYIWSVLGQRNAGKANEFAFLYDEKTLMDNIQIISKNTKEVLNDSSLNDVALNTLISVCSLDHLTVDSKVDLFHAVARYAEAEQRRQGKISSVDGEQMRLEPPTSEEKVLLDVEDRSQTDPAAELDAKPPSEVLASEPTEDKENLKEAPVFAAGLSRSDLLTEAESVAVIENIEALVPAAPEIAAGPSRSDLLTEAESVSVIENIEAFVPAAPEIAAGPSRSDLLTEAESVAVIENIEALVPAAPEIAAGPSRSDLLTEAESVSVIENIEALVPAAPEIAAGPSRSDLLTEAESVAVIENIEALVPAAPKIAAGPSRSDLLTEAESVSVIENIEALVPAAPEIAAGPSRSDLLTEAESVAVIENIEALVPAAPEIAAGPSRSDLLTEAESVSVIENIEAFVPAAPEIAAGPSRSDLLTEAESVAVIENIASTDSAVPIPTGFSESQERGQPRSDSKEQCFEVGSLEHTINALKCGNPEQVKEAALAAANILFTPHNIQPALVKGILDALVRALTKGDNKCRENAAQAIYNLCARGSPSQLSVLAVSPALEAYCRLITARGIIGYSVLNGLTCLLRNVDQNTKIGLLSKLKEIGVPKLLETVLCVHQDAGSFYGENNLQLAINLLQTYFGAGQVHRVQYFF